MSIIFYKYMNVLKSARTCVKYDAYVHVHYCICVRAGIRMSVLVCGCSFSWFNLTF